MEGPGARTRASAETLNDYKVIRARPCAQAAGFGIILQVYALVFLDQFQFLTDEL